MSNKVASEKIMNGFTPSVFESSNRCTRNASNKEFSLVAFATPATLDFPRVCNGRCSPTSMGTSFTVTRPANTSCPCPVTDRIGYCPPEEVIYPIAIKRLIKPFTSLSAQRFNLPNTDKRCK